MRRVIVNFKKLTQNVLDLLVEKYPDGYSDSDIIDFRNAQGELVEAVEVRTEDTIYLVKVSVKLAERMYSEGVQDHEEDKEIPDVQEVDFSDEDIEDSDD